MPNRLRLFDFRMSRGPGLVGICREDIDKVSEMFNTAQRRLLMAKEAGEEGWWGTWAEVLFSPSRTTPYITLPRSIARIELAAACNRPIPVNNQFFEYLQFGNGRLPKTCALRRASCLTASYTRNNVPSFVDPPTPTFYLQAFALDPADIQAAKRMLFQGLDTSGETIYSQDSANQVTGEYVTFASPFVQAPSLFSRLNGVQKDVTSGQVQVMSIDPSTGAATHILTMEPGEEVASYRRYYFDQLPFSCCSTTAPTALPETIAVTAIAKLDLIPALVDQDYGLLQNLEALVEESQSVRLSEIDGAAAKQESRERHNMAIGLLNGELNHYLGKDSPAISFKPFGSASFNRVTRGFL